MSNINNKYRKPLTFNTCIIIIIIKKSAIMCIRNVCEQHTIGLVYVRFQNGKAMYTFFLYLTQNCYTPLKIFPPSFINLVPTTSSSRSDFPYPDFIVFVSGKISILIYFVT